MKRSFLEKLYSRNDFVKQSFRMSAVFILSAFVLVLFTGCNQNPQENSVQDENQIMQNENESIKVGNDGENAGIAKDDDDVTIVSQGKEMSGETVAMSVEDYGRSDPFLPTAGQQTVEMKAPLVGGYELLPPPESITTDDTAAEVIKTTVSGIMYDTYSPSAILKIDDSDYLVRTGDNVNGYKILAIAKDCVTVQHGSNVYKAGVGELLTDDGIKFNNISNLEYKFGGNKKHR